MVREPAVTVIVPVHNGERFVGRALDSLFAQSFGDFIAVVVDDASTDGTPGILAGYHDSRLHVIRTAARLGVAGARNVALDAAVTPYVAFLDSDDVAHPRRLELQMAAFRARKDVQMVASRLAVVDESGSPTGAVWGPEGADEVIPARMLFTNCLATSTIVVDRLLIGNQRFDASLNTAEDYDMWLRLLDKGAAVCLPDALVQYRLHPASLMHTSDTTEDGLRRIARARLARLGVTPTHAELDIHRGLGSGRLKGTAGDLAVAHRWLETLEDANAATHSFPGGVFRQVLSERWLAACDAAARSGAWDAWPRILRSRFSGRLLASPGARGAFVALPWRTVRGFVRRRWPGAGAAMRRRLSARP